MTTIKNFIDTFFFSKILLGLGGYNYNYCNYYHHHSYDSIILIGDHSDPLIMA